MLFPSHDRGVCHKSFPLDKTALWYIGIIDLCHGGMSGMDLIRLPLDGTILDQPAIFYDVRNIIIETRENLRPKKATEPAQNQGQGRQMGQ